MVPIKNGFSSVPDAMVYSAFQNRGLTDRLPVECDVKFIGRQSAHENIYISAEAPSIVPGNDVYFLHFYNIIDSKLAQKGPI